MQNMGSVQERSPMGAMEEGSGKVQKASTYVVGGIGVDVAVGHSDISTVNVEASSL